VGRSGVCKYIVAGIDFVRSVPSNMHRCRAFPFALTSMTLNDLEPPKVVVIVNFLRFRAATRISKVNCAEMAGHRLRRAAYEIFSIECRF